MVKRIEKYNRCNKHACKEIYIEKKVEISFFQVKSEKITSELIPKKREVKISEF